MPKNVFYRDFTICKAVALVALMGLAVALGGVPKSSTAYAGAELPAAEVIPAMVYKAWEDCVPVGPIVDL
ncbi:hypothetical protein [Antarctobacter sp.]|uniref:hypothetical protein n=1 Tax=Antarctobacter sp. TaxID=1872577 RepID=UPI003A919F72